MSVRWPAIWILGAGQCVYWGILYYTFSVLLVPMREEFRVDDAAVAGAFSLGLGVNAWLAARVGHWLDQGHGAALLRFGAGMAAALLVAWSYATSLAVVYLVWIGLGAAMACVLYETAFGIVTRAIADPARRLNALASITVIGGLASTIFLPIDGWGVAYVGWRETLRGLAAIWLATMLLLDWKAIPFLAIDSAAHGPRSAPAGDAQPDRVRVALVGAPFVTATLASIALSVLVIPMLVEHGETVQHAAWVLAALGVMQLPGRLWLWRRGMSLPPSMLLMLPLVLQAVGLFILAAAPTLWLACVGVGTFGVGSGLHTLARPWIVPHLFGVSAAGRVNGAIARAQGVARAIGPFAAASLYGHVGGSPVFALLGIVLVVLCPVAVRTAALALEAELA